ncbi:MAG TPA: hypothetical protein VK927_08315 [Adhaeribacter sp.]|nr:hypothetical protein [Adhaeribacter sp.]
MKKLLTSAFFAFTILAASASNDGNISTQASDIARKMVNQIELSEAQYIQLRQFTIEKLEAEALVKKMYSNDKDMLAKKLSEAENNYNFKLQALLNTKQYNKYAVLKSGKKADTEMVAAAKE